MGPLLQMPVEIGEGKARFEPLKMRLTYGWQDFA